MARVLATSRPQRHVDISASGCFAAVASAFVPVEFCGPRPNPPKVPGARARTIDVAELPFRDASIESVSCTGIVESLGVGLDGDALDADADLKSIAELKRILASDGSLLFVCPVGKPRTVPGSQRVYAFGQVLDYFDGLDLEEFSLIPDRDVGEAILVNPDQRLADRQRHGLGCFWFRKPV